MVNLSCNYWWRKCHKLHIGMPYCGKRFWTRQIPTSCLLMAEMSQASYRYAILWEAVLNPSDSYFLFADLVGFYTHWTYMRGYHKWALAHSSSCWWRVSEYQEKTTDLPAACHWQTLSHNVVSSTHRLSGIRTHNFSGDRYWLHR